MTQQFFAKPELDRLIQLLGEQGYQVIAPVAEEGAIVYAPIKGIADLPQGYSDSQAPGRYRATPSGHNQYFQFNVGPHSWKQYLFPPRVTVATAERADDGWQFATPQSSPSKYALLGIRACELAAIAVQDRVFLEGPYVDPDYRQRREAACLIAVNCTVAATTCFCTSMQCGPKCRQLFDLALTEIADGFVAEIGSPRGAELLARLDTQPVAANQAVEASGLEQRAVDQISKRLDTHDIRNLLLNNLDHPHWDDVATRCLSCTNCTMVCPTCFCTSVSEVANLSGDQVQRVRQWDSCFNIDFSYTASGVVRDDRRSRFRQWLTHKLASWHDQFDSSGCVGCGRCITWCPVGIDLTQEVAAIRETPNTNRQLPIAAPQTKTGCLVPQEKTS